MKHRFRSIAWHAVPLAAMLLAGAAAHGAKVAKPEFDPSPCDFTEEIEVEIQCDTGGATIRYTLDGREPTDRSPEYRKPIVLTETTTITAQAFKDGWKDSEVVEGEFERTEETVEAPVFDPSPRTFTGDLLVHIECATPDAQIYFTNDGRDPTESSTRYSGAGIVVQETKTLKARALKKGWKPSRVTEAEYTRKIEQVAKPEFDPSPRRFEDELMVRLRCSTEKATIRYTLNGDTPTERARVYTDPILLIDETTIRARAFKEGFKPSEEVAAHYTEKIRQVENPRLDPRPGSSFIGTTEVKIECPTAGAEIRYTTNGSDPGPNSEKYRGPIKLDKTTTLMVQAFKEGFKPSEVKRCAYTKATQKVAKPQISPSSRTYTGTLLVTVKCETKAAEVYYTLDGGEPTERSLRLGNGAIVVSESVTVQARAFAPDMGASDIAEATYTRKMEKVARPEFDPGSGKVFQDDLKVRITSDTEDATIRYTLDGSEPTAGSREYKEPLVMVDTTTIKARAFKKGMLDSDVAEAEYIEKKHVVDKPELSPGDTTFSDDELEVEIECDTEDATIYYTVDGGDPDERCEEYKKPIVLKKTARIKARAFREDWEPSAVVVGNYTRKPGNVDEVEASPEGREFTDKIEVKLTCETEQAVIHYTTDGDTPTESDQEYKGPIKLTEDTVLKARAFRGDWKPSPVVTEEYTRKRFPVKDPRFDPKGRSFTDKIEVKITCDTSGATLYYTTDGDEPTERDEKYRGAIKLEKTTTLKVCAFKEGMLPSKVVTEKYELKK